MLKIDRRRKAAILSVLMILLLVSCQSNPAGNASSADLSKSNGQASQSTDPASDGNVTKDIDMKNAIGVTINDMNSVTEETIKTLKDNGIDYVRIPFPYPFASDGETPNMSYLTAKRIAKMFRSSNIKVFGQTFWPGGVGYNSKTGSITWNSNLPDVYSDFNDNYFYIASKAATKFIARDLKDITNVWLISNEPDMSTYTGNMTIEQIGRFINACAEGVKEGNPHAACGVNLFGTVWQDYSMLIVDEIYKEGTHLDWVGLDNYFGTLTEGDPASWEKYLDAFYEKLKLPIIITEWSYSSAETDPLDTFKYDWNGHTRGKEAQGEYAAACMKVFSNHPEIIGTFWYALSDSGVTCWECGNPDCRLYSDWGLLDSKGAPKASLLALKKAKDEYFK